MGKAGRFACIFVPMALTIASLICLILVEIGNQNTSDISSDLFFLKFDMDDFKNDPDAIKGTDLDNAIVNMKVHTKDLKDFYQIGLWNYCSGDIDSDGSYKVTFCSPHEKSYYFDPEKVWGLHSANDDSLGDKLDDAMKVYKKVAGWMWTAYIIACVATGIEIIVGFFAIFSRWGSFATTIVSGVSIDQSLNPTDQIANSLFRSPLPSLSLLRVLLRPSSWLWRVATRLPSTCTTLTSTSVAACWASPGWRPPSRSPRASSGS
jgi:hypothetical protein